MKIISLGSNCEASFRIEDYTNKPLDSYIFSWTASYDPMATIAALEDLHKLEGSTWTISPTGMAINDRNNIGFHTRKTKEELFNDDGTLNEENCNEGIEELNSRMSHLIEKTENLFANDDGEDILFIYKSEVYKSEDSTYLNSLIAIVSLYNVLQKKLCGKREFFLLAVYADEKISEKLKQVNFAKNILFYNVGYFPTDDKRRTGGNKLAWNHAIAAAIKAFTEYKLSKYTTNLLPEINEDSFWQTTKSGDAEGAFDFETRRLFCISKSDSYYGIVHDIDNIKQYEGKTLDLRLDISNVDSERNDVGYFQIWENYDNDCKKTVSTYLANIVHEKTVYQTFYKVPVGLARSRVVIQAKNGSFRIEDLTLSISVLE